jgi:BioD-like phosphotransacetylase family protein
MEERRNNMSTVTFDTLKFVETLKESGIDDKQAKAIASAYQHASEDQEIVTKKDLKIELAEQKYDLLKWIIGLALAQFTVLISILMKLPH